MIKKRSFRNLAG